MDKHTLTFFCFFGLILIAFCDSKKAGISNGSSSKIKSKGHRWPNNTIPYKFEGSYPDHLRVSFLKAARHISKRTCIKFVPRTKQRDYIRVKSGEDCYSYVGRMGGRQSVSLPDDCNEKGLIVHELLHAIGFQHEQSREDRDKYVRINWRNIEKEEKHNFDRIKMDLSTPYDYRSVMHYSSDAFSKNGKDTITPLKKGVKLGQRCGMSEGDIKEVNKLYCGSKTTKNKKCNKFI